MNITGQMVIGTKLVKGGQSEFFAINPATNKKISPAFYGGGAAEVDRACTLAHKAFDTYREVSLGRRADFLNLIAENIMALGDVLVTRAVEETGLLRPRIEGEIARTCHQLRLFSQVVREGDFLGVRIDTAIPDRTPLPRSDLRMRYIPLGPVAVFGASNFPLAFSVAGGDTASALAAGAPVIVKAHSAHPGTSELVAKAIQKAVSESELPEGTFSMLFGSGTTLGAQLVSDPRIKAVGFTGSRKGGMALMSIANARPEPIPVYAEMSSINPVFLMPQALANRAQNIAKGLVGSLAMGAGQFCTNPGLIIAIDSPELDQFIDFAIQALKSLSPSTMLTPSIHEAFENGVSQLTENSAVECLARGLETTAPNQCRAGLFVTTADKFLSNKRLTDEVFGSCSLLVRCKNEAEVIAIAEHLEGQLTATLHMDDADDRSQVKALLQVLEKKAGRILVNGYPTGVEVCHAMVHGGPFPATSASRTTSVGSAAIERFLRPVCYQDFSEQYLPDALKAANPLGLAHLLNGERVG